MNNKLMIAEEILRKLNNQIEVELTYENEKVNFGMIKSFQ